MLAYGLDLQIGIDVGLTVLSALLAVSFTFVALSSDVLYDRFLRAKRKGRSKSKRTRKTSAPDLSLVNDESAEPLLQHIHQANGIERMHTPDLERAGTSYFSKPQHRPSMAVIQDSSGEASWTHNNSTYAEHQTNIDPEQPSHTHSFRDTILAQVPSQQIMERTDSQNGASSELESEGAFDSETYESSISHFSSRRSSSFGMSSASGMGLGGILGMKRGRIDSDISKNPFVAVYEALLAGLSVRNVAKGFFWAIAVTSMHYVGIRGLNVPLGYVSLDPSLVFLSGLICWVVCVVGCILIGEIETNLGQQLLFSAVATCGVAAMHFTGMQAATFYSYAPASSIRGYPPGLATATIAVAISTCIVANLLLAHSATVSRNKLAGMCAMLSISEFSECITDSGNRDCLDETQAVDGDCSEGERRNCCRRSKRIHCQCFSRDQDTTPSSPRVGRSSTPLEALAKCVEAPSGDLLTLLSRAVTATCLVRLK